MSPEGGRPTGTSSSLHPLLSALPWPYLDEPGQPEVPNFADVVFPHEDVPGGQVPVDVILLFQVAHALGHLCCNAHQLRDGQGFLIRVCRGQGRPGWVGPARAKSSLQTPALRGGAGTKGRWPDLKLELWTHCSPCGGLLGIRATTVHTYPLEFPSGNPHWSNRNLKTYVQRCSSQHYLHGFNNNRRLSGRGTPTWWCTDRQDFISDEQLVIQETACSDQVKSTANVAVLKYSPRGGIGRVGGRRKREEIWGYMYAYGWFTLLYSRN